MKGIILQDLLSMRKVMKMYALVLFVYVVIGFFSGSASNFGAFFILFAAMLPMTAFAYREKAHWDLYANVMPVSRKQMVWSSYVLSWLLLAIAGIGNVLLIVIDAFSGNFEETGSMQEAITAFFVILLVGAFYIGLFLPFIYKFGTERSRLLILACYLIPFLAVMFLAKNEELLQSITITEQMLKRLIFVAGPVFVIAWNMISYHISTCIYQKKDLS